MRRQFPTPAASSGTRAGRYPSDGIPLARGDRRRACAAALGACLGWPGCAAWLPQSARPQSTEACSPGAEQLPAEQLLELEHDGRAQPRPCAAELGMLAASGRLDAVGRVEALLLQGWLLAGLSDLAGTEAVARQLDAGRPSGATPLAGAAALLVRARLAEQSGDTAQAGILVDQALARLPADASALNRLRFTSAQSHIRNSASRLEDAIRLDHQALKLADALAMPWRQAEVRNDLAYSYSPGRADGAGAQAQPRGDGHRPRSPAMRSRWRMSTRCRASSSTRWATRRPRRIRCRRRWTTRAGPVPSTRSRCTWPTWPTST